MDPLVPQLTGATIDAAGFHNVRFAVTSAVFCTATLARSLPSSSLVAVTTYVPAVGTATM
jgi:hypothetical protein